ncbi:unnamed protein product [Rotaria socialis]|uniref:NAD(P)(+)--arginine ADP-ribosyltransferase n=1 Tax=Rotaria socialis TaxID=392032 RepID=A0A821H2Y7_9BILA|nr:unnamed protein product [Rotaria socialis]
MPVRGVFVTLNDLVSQITTDQTKRTHNKVDEALPISTFTAGTTQDQSTTGLNGQFVHSQLLIDCLLRIKSTSAAKNELLTVCKEEYEGNKAELEILREFQQDYSPDHALWWYTRNSFVYRLLNKALRVQNIDILFLFRFFICDLQQQLKDNQCTSRVRLYRGQLMSNDELQVLQDSTGQLISINSFLSTSVHKHLALQFLNQSSASNSIERVLFEITADPVAGIKPFANIRPFSAFPEEEETLFMLGSIFRVIDIQQDNEQVWLIQLKLCSENDNDLKSVIDEMKKDHIESGSETSLLSLGNILLNMNEYDSAEKYLFRFLDEQTKDHSDIARCYYLLGNLDTNTYHLDSSLAWHLKSLEIKRKILKSDDPKLSDSYNSIGVIYRKKREFLEAQKWFEKALKILQQAYGIERPEISTCINSIGYVFLRMKSYSNAMDCFKKALAINKKYFTAYHSEIGVSHSSMADAYRGLQNYNEALKHANLALGIFQKSLPPKHYKIAWAIEIMGNVYEDKKELKDALSYYRRAANIYCEILPSTHYYVISIKQCIQRVSSEIN